VKTLVHAIRFVRDDGGRAAAGFKGETGDCVTRAIAIASGRPYREVYDALHALMRADEQCRATGKTSPRAGVPRRIYDPYIRTLGFAWRPTMQIGQGCTVHLRESELPDGALIVRLSRHIAAVIDGVLHDTVDCSRDGTRCVYGYWEPSPVPGAVAP
jgi:hypothetical protein